MMKSLGRSAMALVLALVLTVGLIPTALASAALGDDLHTGTVGLAPGTQLTRRFFWSNTYSDLRTERYFTYHPTQGIRPVVVYGDKVLSKQTIANMGKSLEAQDLRVVGGVNGDFFDMATGNTLGVLISDGVLRSTSGGFHAIGFREDGTAFIGTPDLAVTATFLGHTLRVTDVNKTRTALGDKTAGGYYLYTQDYSKTTQHSAPGIDVILTPVTSNLGQEVDLDLDVTENLPAVTPTPIPSTTIEPSVNPSATPAIDPSATAAPVATPVPTAVAPADVAPIPAQLGAVSSTDLPAGRDVPVATPEVSEMTGTFTLEDQLTVGGRVRCTVDQVLQSTGSIDIPEGKMVLTINNQNHAWLLSQLSSLKPGDTVDIDVAATDARWNEAVTAMGGFYRIVTDGKPGPNTDKNTNPRTALGIKADGSVVLYEIDGKQPGYSVGATLGQVANRMIELGCVDAVGLDGGGSTTMVATLPTKTDMELLNRPSEGSQRAVSTGLFLVSDLKPTGVLDHFYVFPYDALLLAGASVTLNPNPMDTSYYPLPYNEPISWTIHNGDGTVSNTGVFTAGGEPGVTTVTASNGAIDGITGSADMTVVKAPDSMTLTYEGSTAPLSALSLEPNQEAQLHAASVWKKLPLISQNHCYVWTLDPAVGVVDQNGRITAGTKTAVGNLTVSVGSISMTIPVSVTGHIKELERFEDGIGTFVSSDTMEVSADTASSQVRFGAQSLKLTYDTSLTGVATVGTAYTIPSGERYLGLWIYGDGSGNAVTATVVDQIGQTSEVVLTGLDFNGWKQLVVGLPEGTVSIQAMNVIFGGGEKPTGALWLDQLTTSNEEMTDYSAPLVQVSLNGTVVTAKVFDSLDKKFEERAIALTLDGIAHPFQWDVAKSTLTATLAESDGKLHRVTVTATDQAGNLGRGSTDQLSASDTSGAGPFVDMAAHWARPYTTYLHDKGIVNGIHSDAGPTFKPDADITRGEFALMVARWMRLDLTAYADVVLPFADVGTIPNWAVDGIKAMYAEGIIQGSLDNGSLVSRATATISRAEAITILGRIQTKGYEMQPLIFDDTGSVPEWSLAYVQTLTGQGVVSGYENRLRPNEPVKRAEVAKMLYTIL